MGQEVVSGGLQTKPSWPTIDNGGLKAIYACNVDKTNQPLRKDQPDNYVIICYNEN